MNQNKIILIVICLILVVGAVLLADTTPHYSWDIGTVPTPSGEQPYDRKLFDELLNRSLHNGYSVKMLDTIALPKYYYMDGSPSFDKLRTFNSDTALLVIQSYNWECVFSEYGSRDDDDIIIINDDGYTEKGTGDSLNYLNHQFNIAHDLLNFASEGGQVIYVEWINAISSDSRRLLKYFLDYDEQYREDYIVIGNGATALERLKEIEPTPQKYLSVEGDTLTFNHRFIYRPYYIPKDNFEYISGKYRGKRVLVRPILNNCARDRSTLGIEFYFPSSGGHLYMTPLGQYFCNVGLMAPGGDKAISYFMSKIDDRPVIRLDYPKEVYNSTRPTRGQPLLDKIYENPALYLSWILLLVMVALVLSRGFIRRYPVAKGIMADDLDKTDHIAVREYHLRHSPLLHFLFQTSWLFDGKKDYSVLYGINFRRLCRTVSRFTGVELKTAKDDDIKRAAKTLAVRFNRKEPEVYEELKWMKDWAEVSPITPSQFAKSQRIVEQYPL